MLGSGRLVIGPQLLQTAHRIVRMDHTSVGVDWEKFTKGQEKEI